MQQHSGWLRVHLQPRLHGCVGRWNVLLELVEIPKKYDCDIICGEFLMHIRVSETFSQLEIPDYSKLNYGDVLVCHIQDSVLEVYLDYCSLISCSNLLNTY